MNRRQWPIPVLDYSSSSTLSLSSTSGIPAITVGNIGEDRITFTSSIAGILRAGEKVELNGANYEIKYFVSTTIAVLTSVLLAATTGTVTKVRYKYSTINIEFNDAINTPTGVVAMANKSVSIAVPTITAGGAYTSHSQAAIDLKALLDAWMVSTPRFFAVITI